MRTLILSLLRYRPLMILLLISWIAAGIFMFSRLDIEAYPDPSPPLVEVITQNSSWSAEEMERQVTVPTETGLFGIPHLQYTRSVSIFGLSDVKLYFDYDSDYYWDRQEVLNRMQLITLPAGLSPQLSPWSPIGEIYRYRLTGENYSLNELKATQDWMVRRELKQVPDIIDVTTFGGSTKQYQAEVDPRKLLQFKVTLPQVVAAISASNANAGGNYLTMGEQSVNVRGLGLLTSIDEMKNVVVAERNGVPVFLRDVANVHEGYQPRLGQVGINHDADAIEGIVLLQRGEQSLPALKALREKVAALNTQGLLPRGMKIQTLYDRTNLVQLTTSTVRHVVLTGLALVLLLLFAFLGDLRISLIAALTIPCSLLFAFSLMVFTGRSANLISLGAVDFGILVDAAVIVLENIYRNLRAKNSMESEFEIIAAATSESVRPVLFSVLVIIVALIPLFTMEGVPGKIFGPMSVTYGFALTGATIFAIFLAPVLSSFRKPGSGGKQDTALVRWLHRNYDKSLGRALAHRPAVLVLAGVFLAGALVLLPFLGGEFMPKLEEGNLWIRATLPQDISIENSRRFSNEIREILLKYPEVTQVVSQTGRPDDGTDVTTFNNIEFMVSLKSPSDWPEKISKDDLVKQMDGELSKYPGINFNFSQNIQDNVEEAMSGVKGENSLKLFGDDIDVLVAKAGEIRDVMARVPGVEDVGVLQETGQPELLVTIDRDASARYGLMSADVNAAVQAAIGGLAATQILEQDRRFDFIVRYPPEFRETPEAIRDIQLPTPDGGHVPLGQVAKISLHEGAFMIYRENGRRYIPVKFSVRGRDLAGTMNDMQARLAQSVHLPEGYHYEWAGEYDSLKKEQRRLAIVVPVSLLIIVALLFTAFNSFRDALLVLVILPFGLAGGLASLFFTATPFSISGAVGMASVIGVCTLGSVVMLSGIRRAEHKAEEKPEDYARQKAQENTQQKPEQTDEQKAEPIKEDSRPAIERGALAEMRPVLMACAAAGLGLLPGAVSTGIGVQAQQPLARVVVGGMVTSPLAILFLLPILASFFSPTKGNAEGAGDEQSRAPESQTD